MRKNPTELAHFFSHAIINAGWSVRKLKRQKESLLFERLLLSKGDINKEEVLKLATRGNEYSKPDDRIKDPYVFEFLGITEAAGQLNMYLNYYAEEVNDADDNPSIGIILCIDKNSIKGYDR